MAKYLFDTNILLRLSDRISANYALARDATYILIEQGHKCCLTSQIIIEFWVVATRPTEVNGLGWTPERTKNQINQFLTRFTVLEETPEIFTLWLISH
jgi:predicted nucleic acid-binding protein